MKKAKEFIDRLKTAASGRLHRFVMWAKANKRERHLMKNGWKRNSIGRWKSPKKNDFRTYSLRQALKEENFYWLTR